MGTPYVPTATNEFLEVGSSGMYYPNKTGPSFEQYFEPPRRTLSVSISEIYHDVAENITQCWYFFESLHPELSDIGHHSLDARLGVAAMATALGMHLIDGKLPLHLVFPTTHTPPHFREPTAFFLASCSQKVVFNPWRLVHGAFREELDSLDDVEQVRGVRREASLTRAS